VRRIPGVAAAALSTHSPLSGSTWTDSALPAGQALGENDTALFIGAAPGFFGTMRTPLVAGREFRDDDSKGSRAVAVISEAYAQRYFPRQTVIGQHLTARFSGQVHDLEIVGLARDVRSMGLRRPPYPAVYVPLSQVGRELSVTLEVRAIGSLAQTATAIRRVVQARLPSVPVEVKPLSAQVGAAIAQERLMATLVTVFGALALTLACTGLYGLLGYTVAQRRREIGNRLALGAQARALLAMILSSAARLIAIGVAVGMIAAWAFARGIESMLFGLTATDPAAIAGAIGVLTAAALTAAYIPALRASRVDPMVTLRHE
jgi:predicted permease